MARIPNEVVADIISKVDILEVIRPHVELKRIGKEWVGLSPVTKEKTPSFTVVPAKQIFKDFSGGEGGHALKFYTKVLGIPFREAVQKLADIAGVDVTEYFQLSPKERQQENKLLRLSKSLGAIVTMYRQTLLTDEARSSREYLVHKRKLKAEDVPFYELGFAPRRHGLSVDVSMVDAIACGAWVNPDDRSPYPRFRDRIIFPIRDERGHLVSMGGRLMSEGRPKYLNGPETEIFHKSRVLYGLYQCLKRAKEKGQYGKLEHLILGEGYFDAITPTRLGFNAAGVMSAVASEAQLKLAARHAKTVYVATDGDPAGRRGERKTLERLVPHMNGETEFRFMRLPADADLDDIGSHFGASSIQKHMDAALPASEVLLQLVVGDPSQFKRMSIEDRARTLTNNGSLLAPLPDGPLRAMVFQALAQVSGVQIDTINNLIPASPRAAVSPISQGDQPATQVEGGRETKVAMDVLRLSLNQEPDSSYIDLQAIEKMTPEQAAEYKKLLFKKSPALRAAQFVLHQHLQLDEWVTSPLTTRNADGLRGGALLQDMIQMREESPSMSVGEFSARLEEHPEGFWLHYILNTPPQVSETVASATLAELIRKCVQSLDAMRLDELLEVSTQRDLNDHELREIELLTDMASATSLLSPAEAGTPAATDGVLSPLP